MATKKYKAPACEFFIRGNHIETDGSVRHKCSGTSLAGILNCSPFTTPFQIACSLLGVCSEDLDGKFAVEFGKAHESTIIDYLNEAYPDEGIFIPAEDVFEKREGDHDSWESDFEDDVFAGHVDGIVTNGAGEDFILEIKTSSKIDDWTEGVPLYYWLQVALYNHFITKREYAYVGLGMRSQTDSIEDWKATDDNVRLFKMKIDPDDFNEKLEKVRAWYEKYIMNGITPDFDPTNHGDLMMWNYLKSISKEDNEVQASVDRLLELKEIIDSKKLDMEAIETEYEALKESLRSYMSVNGCDDIRGSNNKFKVCMSRHVRKSIDDKLLREDGIDPAKYTVSKIVETFSIKPIKDEE